MEHIRRSDMKVYDAPEGSTHYCPLWTTWALRQHHLIVSALSAFKPFSRETSPQPCAGRDRSSALTEQAPTAPAGSLRFRLANNASGRRGAARRSLFFRARRFRSPPPGMATVPAPPAPHALQCVGLGSSRSSRDRAVRRSEGGTPHLGLGPTARRVK